MQVRYLRIKRYMRYVYRTFVLKIKCKIRNKRQLVGYRALLGNHIDILNNLIRVIG